MPRAVELRRHARVPFQGAVRCTVAPATTIFSPGGNLSTGGMLLKARSNLSPGTEMSIRFQIPYMGDLVEARGIVRWRQLDTREEETLAVGVEFVDLQPAVRERLQNYIETQTLGVL